MTGRRNTDMLERIKVLADGKTSSSEIAAIVGITPRVVRKYITRYNLPRLPNHCPSGERNPSYKAGRRIALDGYATVSAPEGHPYARHLRGKNIGRILEHRLVMEQKLGRYLLPTEVVDHIDGLTLHNHPDNLRLFATNGEHLAATRANMVANWSPAGKQNQFLRHSNPQALVRVDTHRDKKKSGELRLHQILMALEKFGPDSPYLLGAHQWLKKAGIRV